MTREREIQELLSILDECLDGQERHLQHSKYLVEKYGSRFDWAVCSDEDTFLFLQELRDAQLAELHAIQGWAA